MDEFVSNREIISNKTIKFSFHRKNEFLSPITWKETIYLWQKDEKFREFFIQILKKESLKAFFWETPPINQNNYHESYFEFVVIQSDDLEKISPDPSPFKEHFEKKEKSSSINQSYQNNMKTF